ncbi:unnamed protein product [Rangifer tarandus platyrhynchus]|uniref:Uncharacterized protein n=2 Tax=Rangifer tarandus platyrhynchus TaxID=3082113 RepID=A0AC59YC36_RANTA|nr:unnamed protein product [Rangifer tarandus platyrhynchus]
MWVLALQSHEPFQDRVPGEQECVRSRVRLVFNTVINGKATGKGILLGPPWRFFDGSVQFNPSVVSDSLRPHGAFLRSQFFASGGPSIGASASVSVLPMNIQD